LIENTSPSASSPRGKRKRDKPFQSKKGRPTAAQTLAIDSAIVKVATERFLAEGYNGASMDAVALAVGISKGTLYSRYPHKESLFRAVVKVRVDDWEMESSNRGRVAAVSLEECLKQHIKTIMSKGVSAESRAFDRLFNSAFGVSPEILNLLYEMRYQRGVDYLAQLIREHTGAEGKPARNAQKVAATLLAALAGWLRVEISLRAVTKKEAIAFGYYTIDLLIAGRAAW
jgi:TetR/AcrR family transcriptional regulator, mexJK operon transcriptional repressor